MIPFKFTVSPTLCYFPVILLITLKKTVLQWTLESHFYSIKTNLTE